MRPPAAFHWISELRPTVLRGGKNKKNVDIVLMAMTK